MKMVKSFPTEKKTLWEKENCSLLVLQIRKNQNLFRKGSNGNRYICIKRCCVHHKFIPVFQVAYFLIQFDSLVCPITYDDDKGAISMECVRHPVFVLEEYQLPETLQLFFKLVSMIWSYIFNSLPHNSDLSRP